MIIRKCKDYFFETVDMMVPILLGMSLGFFVMIPVFKYVNENVYPKINEAWSMACNLGETARVIKQPLDTALVEVLEEAGFEVASGNKVGQIKFGSGPWSATLFNEVYRVKMISSFKGTQLMAEEVNKWNSQYLYTRIYSDGEGDSVLQSDMYLGDDGVSRDALVGFCRMYGKSVDSFTGERLKETLTKLLGEDTQDKKGREGNEIHL